MKAPLVLTHIWITRYQTASNLKYKSYLRSVKVELARQTQMITYTGGFNCSDRLFYWGQYVVLVYFSSHVFLDVFFFLLYPILDLG